MSDKRLIWCGAAMDPSGYGEATRGYLMAMAGQQDVSIKLTAKNFWHGDPPDLRSIWPTLEKLHSNNFDRRRPYVFLQHLTPDQWLLGAGACKYHIGMTTFETTSLPAPWMVNMRAMDELWTFSNWAKGIFEERGIRRPITVIPHGVDVMKFRPGLQPLKQIRPATNSSYIFGANFDWTERKNPRALLQAYFSTFKADDPVCLAIKSYYQFPIEQSREYITAYINGVKHQMGLKRTPRILLITDMMAPEIIPNFYASLDAYVLPSRGEGWGLTYSEAMATGLPTVAVNWSGHTEFMTDQNSILCKNYRLRQISRADAGAQEQYVGHEWAEVDPEELGSNMRTLFEKPQLGQKIGEIARRDMMTKYSWQNAGRLALARLNEIYGGL
jgi:glycosyltransferase involved in cell wall biosynthesis